MKGDMFVREARVSEAGLLTEIAYRSMKVWRYPSVLNQAWQSRIGVNASFIKECMSYVVLIDGRIKGFWCQRPVQELSDARVFIEPDCINMGLGRVLFRAVRADALKRGLSFLTLVSDPNAIGFYEKLGFKKINERGSTVIVARMLPIMKFDLKNIEID